jgi:hypothetical protein
MPPIRYFLIVFDKVQGALVEERVYEHAHEAARAYEAEELRYRGERNIEVVLLGSDSEETIRATHANYFDVPTTSPFLAAAT